MQYYRFLGLKRGESRSDVIRSAAEAMATALSVNEHHFRIVTADKRRADIATAAYRLLDPRGRRDLYERVQLSYPIDRDEVELPKIPLGHLVQQMKGTPKARLTAGRNPSKSGSAKTRVPLMDQPVVDDAIDPKEPSSHRVQRNTLNSIEERREIIRAIQGTDESTLRGLSPLGWLRSMLGL